MNKNTYITIRSLGPNPNPNPYSPSTGSLQNSEHLYTRNFRIYKFLSNRFIHLSNLYSIFCRNNIQSSLKSQPLAYSKYVYIDKIPRAYNQSQFIFYILRFYVNYGCIKVDRKHHDRAKFRRWSSFIIFWVSSEDLCVFNRTTYGILFQIFMDYFGAQIKKLHRVS